MLVITPKHGSFSEQEFKRKEIKTGKYSPMEVLEKKNEQFLNRRYFNLSYLMKARLL